MENENLGTLVLVDSYNLIYRAFHGNQAPLKNKDGLPTNALYTFAKMMQSIRKDYDITYAVAVFDGGENFRKEIDEEYKANRKEMPEALKLQMPHIPKMLEALGWPILKAEKEEADDIIATLAVRAAQKGFKVLIFSGDKDFRAIVNDRITVVDTMSGTNYDREKIFEKMGVYPENVRDYLILTGDSVDNVGGVPGCGGKTAAKWLNQYGNLSEVIKHKDEIKGVVGDNLRKVIESGDMDKAMKLITMKTDVELNLKKKDITLNNVNIDLWNAFCEEMSFKTFNLNMVKPK